MLFRSAGVAIHRILELDRGGLIDWNGDYASFLVHKEATLAAEETANALFDKRLAQEEVWIRQGIKARRTRNEGRVRALKALRVERSERRERTGKANILLDTRAALIIIYTLINLPIVVWMIYTYFKDIPRVDARPPLLMGSSTRITSCHRLAPSRRAASRMSLGMSLK